MASKKTVSNKPATTNKIQKFMGKIVEAQYGMQNNNPDHIGLRIAFSLDGGKLSTTCGEKFCSNLKSGVASSFLKQTQEIHKLLNDAKRQSVAQLAGVPVEVTVQNEKFKDFRVLTEVI